MKTIKDNITQYNISSMKRFDIDISEIEKIDTKDLVYSHLILKFSGTDANVTLVNTLRRIMLNNIPTYAFPPECIQIEQNTSIFNNDQMRVRLMQLPILSTPLDLAYLEDKYWLDVDYSDVSREKHPLEKNIELYISSVNSDENIKSVTTNDIKYYVDGERIEHKYNEKYPIVLIKLRPSEIFKCRMKATIGIGEKNVIWAAAGNAFYQLSGNDIIITVESHGQFSEYEILLKACKYMQQKLADAKQQILTKYESLTHIKEPIKNIELTLDNETYTFGNMIVEALQNDDKVVYASVGKLNELVKQITLNIEYKTPTDDPLEILFSAFDVVTSKMNYVENIVSKLGITHGTTHRVEQAAPQKSPKKTLTPKKTKK